jgi:hypothetical protein
MAIQCAASALFMFEYYDLFMYSFAVTEPLLIFEVNNMYKKRLSKASTGEGRK